MTEEERTARDRDDAELEREVRARRKFSLAEAIGRAAGDLMKGASPVTRERQAELEIEQYLEARLTDAAGALAVVLKRRVLGSEALLAAAYERPLEALARVVEHLLASEARLRRFVTRVDAEWGRIYSELPFFEREGGAPRPGDPYTVASVRGALAELLEQLGREPAGSETGNDAAPAGPLGPDQR